MQSSLKSGLLSGIVAAQLFSSTSQAETYYVDLDVDVTVGAAPLSLTQIQSMSFPAIKIDDATQEGASCFSSHSNQISTTTGQPLTNADSLCPRLHGQASIVEILGSPNAMITLYQSAQSQVQNGIEFRVQDGASILQLGDTDGKTQVSLLGVVTLTNKQEIKSGLITFSYDITAAYQ